MNPSAVSLSRGTRTVAGSTARFILAALLAASVAGCGARVHSAPASAADSSAIRQDINYLASDELQGRLIGTPGNDTAAAYIARRYAQLGLEPLSRGYLQPFDARSVAAMHAGRTQGVPTQNVVALLRGRDPALNNQYVVVGAHFDHLGRSTEGALDPSAGDAIRNGADDNASGTAAVMQLARMFAASPPRRSIIFVNFSGEEEGLLGSRWFVEQAPVPVDSMVAMVNFDMVGRLHDNKLIVYGTATATELPEILSSANLAPELQVTGIGDGYGPSDHSSFYEKGMPVLHFFTDLHPDYHTATDDADKINAGGEARVVNLAARVIRNIADRPGRLSFVRTAAPTVAMGSGQGSDVYLGSVPDMSAVDVQGLRLSGVRPGSPADLAGLRTGDVIIEFGGKPVNDLYAYSDALYSHKPGDEVTVVLMRENSRMELQVKLAQRP